MPKSLRTFIQDCQRELPGEVIHITKEVNPANYDVTAIIKHLGAQKKFPIIIFDKPLNLNGKVGPIKLTMNCEISQGKAQIALGMPRDIERVPKWPRNVGNGRAPRAADHRRQERAPVKENTMAEKTWISTRFRSCATMKWTAGPISFCPPSPKTRRVGIYNCSYHRMEVKSKNTTALYASPRHLWKIYRDYEDA